MNTFIWFILFSSAIAVPAFLNPLFNDIWLNLAWVILVILLADDILYPNDADYKKLLISIFHQVQTLLIISNIPELSLAEAIIFGVYMIFMIIGIVPIENLMFKKIKFIIISSLIWFSIIYEIMKLL